MDNLKPEDYDPRTVFQERIDQSSQFRDGLASEVMGTGEKIVEDTIVSHDHIMAMCDALG